MKSKALIPLVAGLAVGVVAIKYTMDTVRAAKGKTTSTETVTVVMAQKDIPATVGITPDMVVVAQTPKTPLLPAEIFSELTQIEGRVALKSIPRGVPILPSMLAPEGTKPGLTVLVKEGFRAVAVKIDESTGVGYLVHPGDWVDVMAVMETRKFGKVHTESKLVLERVQVAAVGQALNDSSEEGAARNVQTVTLLVEVDDVTKLHLAQTRGRLTLAMRGSDDLSRSLAEEDEDDEAEKESALSALAKLTQQMNAQPAPPPAPPVEPEHTVVVVNDSAEGDARDHTQHVTFSDSDSMNVIDVKKGRQTKRQPAPRRALTPAAQSRRDAADENESVENETETNEVTE
jgi:Flp pilus assembly protein CpaB